MTDRYMQFLADQAVRCAGQVIANRKRVTEFKRMDYVYACECDKASARWEEYVIGFANQVIAARAKEISTAPIDNR